MFNHSEQTLRDVCAQALELAKAGGATAAEADVSESIGQSVQVRLQEIEHIEYQQDKSLDLTVYVGRPLPPLPTPCAPRSILPATPPKTPAPAWPKPP